MPVFSPAERSQFAERRGTHIESLLWVTARNRDTGLPEALGFWTGEDHQEFLIGTEIRTYYGGAVIDTPPVTAQTGFVVRNYRVSLPPFLDEVKAALKIYDPRLAPVELHTISFDLDTGNQLGPPVARFRGFLNEAPEERGGKGREARTEMVMVSSARLLTSGKPLKRSNAELQRRNPADKGREYSDIAGDVTNKWG
jgi:hypothetical protein